MTLPLSGPISINAINIEVGLAAITVNSSLLDRSTYFNESATPNRFSELYGKDSNYDYNSFGFDSPIVLSNTINDYDIQLPILHPNQHPGNVFLLNIDYNITDLTPPDGSTTLYWRRNGEAWQTALIIREESSGQITIPVSGAGFVYDDVIDFRVEAYHYFNEANAGNVTINSATYTSGEGDNGVDGNETWTWLDYN